MGVCRGRPGGQGARLSGRGRFQAAVGHGDGHARAAAGEAPVDDAGEARNGVGEDADARPARGELEGALDEVPGIAGLPERILVLGTSEVADDGTLLLFADMLNPTVFVNGQQQPTIAIAPGETQRWRIVNASVFTFLDLALVKEFTGRQRDIPGASWALGWDTPSPPSSGGRFISETSFGHLGYTGTSVWIDPKCELEMVLLSNRVHPTRRNERIKTFRPLIHELIYREYQNRS